MIELLDIASISPITASTALLAVILVYLLYIRRDKDLPPGPLGVPFLGLYPFLKDEYHLQLREMSKKYGDVIMFSLTGQNYIHINSLKILREAFVSKGDCYGNRGTRYSIINHCYEKGVGLLEGESWKVLRKFYVQTLKEYGWTSVKGNMSGTFDKALQDVTEDLKSRQGSPFDSVIVMTKYCTSIVQELLFRGIEIKKQDLEDLNKAYWDMLSAMRGTRLLLTGPLAKYIILPYSSGHREMVEGKKTMVSILTKIIDDHGTNLDEDNPRDFVDCYITERNVRTRKNDPTARYFTNEGLVASLIQFLGDGSLTNGYFIAALMNALARHPDVQEKIHSEIVEVVGTDRQPSIEDKSNLPYTSAAILEFLRTMDFAPIFPTMMCTRETTLGGYKIPVGSIALINFYSMLYDPETYKNPEVFDPTRFIGSPDKPKEETPVIFGVGKRSCAGEALTMNEAFLFLTTIVKSFRVALPPDGPELGSYLVSDISVQICAHPRQEE